MQRGFALVISLSLMVLLTVLAVGMLGLSTISLRSSTHGEAMATARANARLALMMAVGDLQKKAGPDQRITAPANLGKEDLAGGLTGVWRSWKADPREVAEGDYEERKSGDHFLGYLVSDPKPGSQTRIGELPTGDEQVTLVGQGSTGKSGNIPETRAAVVGVSLSDKPEGSFAWVAMDDSVKARLDLEPQDETGALGDKIAALGSAARNRFENVAGLEFLEGKDMAKLRADLPKLVSLRETELSSTAPDELARYYHDFTVHGASLQTNVADGGLKTDLSVLFEGPYRQALPGEFDTRYLYSGTATPFPTTASNSDIRWSLLANYARLYQLSSSADGNLLTGLKAKPPTGYLMKPVTDNSAAPAAVRYEPRMANIKEPVMMPTVVRVDTVFSLVSRKAHQGRGTAAYPYQLHMMYLPVITLHNPYSVPLRCTNLQLEFSDIPLGFEFIVNGQPASTGGLVPMNKLFQSAVAKKTFSVTLSSNLSTNAEVMMGPGETRIFGTPFSKDATWASELAKNGDVMFDWANNKTGNVRMIPAMITGPNDGIGFDVDWLAPSPRADWATARRDEGVLMLKGDDDIRVRFGPMMPVGANGAFTVITRMGTQEIGRTQVFYKDQTRLTPLLSEGVSPRFPDPRSFPASFPDAGASPLKSGDLLEDDGTAFRAYVNARPFAVFSVGAKTTVESFTKARPLVDTGVAYQMATCDFRATNSQGTSPLEMALVPVKNGSAAIESDGDKGFFFGGHGSTNGTTAATIYEVPLAPLQSLAQLRHANGASLGISPMVTYTVGESRAHPAIPANVTNVQQAGSKFLLDHSWLANAALWDGYWFSSLSSLKGPAFTGSSSVGQRELAEKFFAGERLLPNPRNTPYITGDVTRATEAALAAEGRSSAAYMLTEGGFNVNSTSPAAWAAVLSSLADANVPLVNGSLEASAGSPFPRYRRPVYGKADPTALDRDKLWNSYRSLTAAEIKALSERIVDEVRLRGPFLSMAEFVNRRIGQPGELTSNGALQAALDKSGVNVPMDANARSIEQEEVSTYGWLNPTTLAGSSTGAGAPGAISQGDLLSVIGSFVTVRSDTFTVRAYGDAKDPDGKVVARAWCEATVQRFPEYLDPADAPEAIAASEANVRFGRRFEIISFRWLSPGEI